ncbi:MAG TPA: radical SAM family heme chaperone HemW [Bacteroidota bacterium]|nr:radical SAM family heme chaperone HemW [Bacteroidota bacterium]
MASIYIHIPFCEHKCLYCDFYSIAPSESQIESDSLTEFFLQALSMEIELRSQEYSQLASFETIFFGGGTPSLLSPEQLASILNQLSSKFSIANDAEITLETNPGTVNREKLNAFRSIGINRLSIGVQSFFDDDLRFLTRIHSSEEAKQCVRDAQAEGFENINLDLIFSLPHQTPERWLSNLEQAAALSPQHLSCYSLIVEPNTPLFRMVETKQVSLLNTEQDAELYEHTMNFFAAHGFEQYEVSNFAMPGFFCKHNMNYWNHTNYLSFGPSAHSFWNNTRWWNISHLQTYIDKLNDHIFPVAGSEQLTREQLMNEAIFLGLRSTGINAIKFKNNFGIDFFVEYASVIHSLQNEHLASVEQNRLRLTSKGYLLCDEICQMFR